ncbi:hypothetical protein XNA1_660002 [Xenorhabdus nematophila str. Anatoliense]|nr:hypothetical protein XNA1_2700002 [Xenorhabdus nematophila str. Anatoliense]CEE95776.1 hypothetical protein XNA1_660002 [Xenorhabdus nematophila str. Anatoliense]
MSRSSQWVYYHVRHYNKSANDFVGLLKSTFNTCLLIYLIDFFNKNKLSQYYIISYY